MHAMQIVHFVIWPVTIGSSVGDVTILLTVSIPRHSEHSQGMTYRLVAFLRVYKPAVSLTVPTFLSLQFSRHISNPTSDHQTIPSFTLHTLLP